MVLVLDSQSRQHARILDAMPLAPPYRCGTLTPDKPLSGASEAVRALNWSGYGQGCAWIKIVDEHGNPIIEGEKPESTYHGLKD